MFEDFAFFAIPYSSVIRRVLLILDTKWPQEFGGGGTKIRFLLTRRSRRNHCAARCLNGKRFLKLDVIVETEIAGRICENVEYASGAQHQGPFFPKTIETAFPSGLIAFEKTGPASS